MNVLINISDVIDAENTEKRRRVPEVLECQSAYNSSGVHELKKRSVEKLQHIIKRFFSLHQHNSTTAFDQHSQTCRRQPDNINKQHTSAKHKARHLVLSLYYINKTMLHALAFSHSVSFAQIKISSFF